MSRDNDLPEVVRIHPSPTPVRLELYQNGTLGYTGLDGMSSGNVTESLSIRTMGREEQYRHLAEAYHKVLREIAFSGNAPGYREVRRMACLAVGLHWLEPEGKVCATSQGVSEREAVRVLLAKK